jgi:hypothetical protein
MRNSCLLILALIFSVSTVEASQNQLKPSLSLTSFNGDVETIQSVQDPLLLQVMISNDAAVAIDRDNQSQRRLLEQARDPELENPLSEQELADWEAVMTAQELPLITLGSTAMGITDLLNFQIRDEAGRNINITPVLLRSFALPNTAMTFGLDEVFYTLFAIDSVDLELLKPGAYQIAVGLDTRAHSSMWQGFAFSNVLKVELHTAHPDTEWEDSSDKAHVFAHYLLANEEFELGLMHTQTWTRQYPESSLAWSYYGDALAHLGENQKAVDAYYTAIEKFMLEHNGKPREAPRALMQRIDEIEEQL